MHDRFADYRWETPEACSHGYLFPALLELLRGEALSMESLILDAGCGGGAMAAALCHEGYTNIYGFDLSRSGIEVARKVFPHMAKRFFIHNSYESRLPQGYPQRNFDLIISTEVIEHLYNPGRYLANINKWLKPEGLLILTTPYHGYIKNVAIAMTNKFDKHMTVNWEGGHIKFFSKRTLYSMLAEYGFQPIKFEGCGRIPYLWKSMIVTAKKK